MTALAASIGSVAAGQKAILGCARWYQPGSRPLVVFGHGYTGDAGFVVGGAAAWWAALIDAGFPCVSTDLGGTATFGNATGVAAVGTAITYATSKLAPASGAVLLCGASMSTLTFLNYTKANASNVRAAAIINPAPDLQYLHDTAPENSQNGLTVAASIPNLAADIETSAGGAGNLNSTYYTATSPVVYAPSTLAGIPIHFWTSPDDVVAGGPTVTAPMETALGASFTETVLPTQAGLGHSAVGIDLHELVAFMAAHS